MRLSFRQGIVQHQIPDFLNVGSSYVDLVVTNTPLVITLADNSKDYLYVEDETVPNAWGPIVAGVDQWLYWDLDKRTGLRTFGITLLDPVHDVVAPSAPSIDQHWFDVATQTMNVWSGSRWNQKIRVFACKLTAGVIPSSISINAPDFKGTQAGLVVDNYAGQILFHSSTGAPLKDSNGKFVTTEDQLTTGTISSSDIKLASLVLSAEAQENLAAYTIVKFNDFGRILHADQFVSTQSGQFGIIQESVIVGDLVNVIVSGAVTNPSWNWSTVNAYLYVDNTGVLTETSPSPGSLPVAVVVDRTTIVLGSPQNVITNTTVNNPATTVATETTQGTVRLNIPATNPLDPVAIGDNDPRLTDDRNPLAHTHPQSEIDNLVTDLADRVLKTGDTMSGPLTLDADPTLPLQAATKQYADGLLSSASTIFALLNHTHVITDVVGLDTALDDKVDVTGDTMSGFLTLSADPTDPLHAATKQYVDSVAGGGGGGLAPDTQVVYGTGTGIDSSASFTYDVTDGAFSVNHPIVTVPTAGAVTIRGATPSGINAPGGPVEIYGGNGNGTSSGGAIELTGGGGSLYASKSWLYLGGAGGYSQAGEIYLNVAGATLTDPLFNGSWWSGGNVDIGINSIADTGNTTGITGGNVEIYAQSVGSLGTTPAADVTAGSVNIRAGSAPVGANDGAIELFTNNTSRLKITGTGEWEVGGSAGTSGQILTSNGTGTAPTWAAAPVSVNEPQYQVVIGTGSGVDSYATLQHSNTNGWFSLNASPFAPAVPSSVYINGATADPSGFSDAGGVYINGGNAGISATGGEVQLSGGETVDFYASGAYFLLSGGWSPRPEDGVVGATSRGGSVQLYGGNATAKATLPAEAGSIDIIAGTVTDPATATAVTPGHLYLSAGSSSGTGASTQYSGDISLVTDNTVRLKIKNTGDWEVGGSAGTSGQVLTSGGAGSAPSWTSFSGPSAPLTEITFGTGTGLTSSVNFYYNSTTGAFGLNEEFGMEDASTLSNPGNVYLFAPRTDTDGTLGGEMWVGAGHGAAYNGAGGYLWFRGGFDDLTTNQAEGGDLDVQAGGATVPAVSTDASYGGNLTVKAGSLFRASLSSNPSTRAGSITIEAGAASDTFSVGAPYGTPSKTGDIILRTNYTERLRITGSGEWQLATSAGSTGQVLTSNGAGAAPTWQSVGGTVSEPNNQLVFGTGAGVDSSAAFTFDTVTRALVLDGGAVAAPANSELVAAGTVSGAGANFTIAGGEGSTGGGSVYIDGGTSTGGSTGNVFISSPNAAAGQNSGAISLTTGTVSGGGTSGAITFSIGASQVGTFTGNGNFVLGTAALSTTATNGFPYIPGMAGTPTGVPTSYTGRYPVTFDSTNNKLYVYDGSWIDVAAAATVVESANQIVYGTGSGVDSSSFFTFNPSTLAFTLGGTAATPGNVSLAAASNANPSNGGNFSIAGGAAGAGAGNGGNVTISGGAAPAGTAGSVIINTAGTERLEIAGNGEWQVGGSAGTAGYALTSNGAGAAPTWQAVTPTFPLTATDGTELLPSYTFSGDTNTGLYRPATDTVGITVNAQEVARFEQDAITFSNGSFVSFGDAISSKYILRILTTDATPTEMLLNGSGRMTLQDDSSWTFTITVIARDISTGDTGSYELRGAIKRGTGAATTSLVGTIMKSILAEDTGASAWDANATADATNGALKIEVTGSAATDIRWVAVVDTVEVVG